MDKLIYALELVGTAVFAVSGALAASRARMDIFGFSFVALMPAVGGGTLRDVVLGRLPVFWISDTNFVLVAITASVLVFFFADRPGHRREMLVWMDAVGLALFAVLGAEVALQAGTNSLIAIVMGVVTAVAGGVARDIICNEIPLVLSKEIYATAAFVASAIFVVVTNVGLDRELALTTSLFLGFLTRAVAIHFGLALPSYQNRG